MTPIGRDEPDRDQMLSRMAAAPERSSRIGRLSCTSRLTRQRRVFARPTALLPFVCLLCGCGYMVGSAYQAEIRSVHVPAFTSESFRRGLEFQLTESVHKEIQSRTPYRLVNGPVADSRLSGRILDIRKDVLGESAFDDPRELQLRLVVEVTWEDLRSGRILAQQRVPVQLNSQSSFAPEVGQSLATGMQQATDQLARQIVEMMEMPW